MAQPYLDGGGPGGHFIYGDLVLVEGLGWFRVEDMCEACSGAEGLVAGPARRGGA